MLAAHYALLYPRALDRLVMVNPIGLEDWSRSHCPA
jgi:pimeloyl-ACP methyl ester carboxylesterase